MQNRWQQASAEFYKPEKWLGWAESLVHVAIILVGAWLLNRIVRKMLRELRHYIIRVMDKRSNGATGEMEKRATTIVSALSKATGIMIWMLAIVMALTELNFHIEPLLAGLGVAGIAVGFGAQTLIKDWLGGLFILIEDQLRIGDGVTINGFSGTVEEINLRTTILRAENGAVHIIANGSITALSNMTREYSYYVFETTVGHGADVDRALAILSEEGAKLADEEPYKAMILAPMELMGVDRLGDRGATLKARIKTLPSKQAVVGRELNRRVKARLDGAGIAFPQIGLSSPGA
jgi:small-conductance mechanosensitive channel